jgi:hypothetical protein
MHFRTARQRAASSRNLANARAVKTYKIPVKSTDYSASTKRVKVTILPDTPNRSNWARKRQTKRAQQKVANFEELAAWNYYMRKPKAKGRQYRLDLYRQPIRDEDYRKYRERQDRNPFPHVDVPRPSIHLLKNVKWID